MFLQEQKITTTLQHKGLTKLLGLSFEIHFKRSVENTIVDALSRVQEGTFSCNVITQVQPKWVEEICSSCVDDPEVTQLTTQLLVDPTAVPDVTLN